MSKKFSPEDVRKIARLSSLELTTEETDLFVEQFSTIFEYFEVLKTSEIPETATDYDESHLSGGRKDQQVNSPVSPEQFSSYLEDGFFKAPRVIEAGS